MNLLVLAGSNAYKPNGVIVLIRYCNCN